MSRVRTERSAAGTINVHEDIEDRYESTEEEVMIDNEDVEGDVQSDAGSYSSEGSDDVSDPAVEEDMRKFEQAFEGITDRFRLINRIGEGESHFLVNSNCLLCSRNILDCL